ncbi:MAG: hypothetical protein HC896_14290 [Bacteroidales bacterium]|nr:hypothetical protein [Bacteroidales bacterium]
MAQTTFCQAFSDNTDLFPNTFLFPSIAAVQEYPLLSLQANNSFVGFDGGYKTFMAQQIVPAPVEMGCFLFI